MSEQSAPEPTMEEILASIRRIISEDEPAEGGEPAEPEAPSFEPMEAASPPPAPAPQAKPEPQPEPEPEPAEEDVLELTNRVEPEAPPETLGDLEINPLPEPRFNEPAPAPVLAPIEAKMPPGPSAPAPAAGDFLVGDPAASAAAAAFGRLSGSMAMPAEGRTLEDVVRELLRPLLKEWLDENLTTIVQATVDQEVERIARGRVR